MARVSTADQAAADHHSMPVQLERMRSLAERNGWEVVRTFEIPGESAFTDDIARRPEFDAAIRAAEAREFEVLIVYDFSRFARDQYLAHASLRRLRKVGCRLVGSNGTDYTADEDMAGMEAIFAARASRDHSRRVSAAIDRRHALGLPTGDIPFGYRRAGSNLEPPAVVPDEAEAIRWAYRSFASAGSLLAIAEEFNRRGLRPRSKSRRMGVAGYVRPANEAFTVTGIQRILENAFYLGYVQHHGEQRRGLHEAIVDEELFASVQARKRRGTRAPRSEALLSGLAVCARCQRGLWCESNGRHRYYRERRRGLLEECEGVGGLWRAEEPEGLIGATVAAMASLEGDWLDWVERRARRPRRTSSARAELEERRRRVTNAYLQGGLKDADYEAAMGELARQLAELGPDIDTALFAGERVRTMAKVWEVASASRRRELVRTLMRRVELDVVGRTLAVDPWPEYEGLFALRREYVGVITPGRTRTSGL